MGGSNATCIQAAASGGVTFTARNGSEPGYQPFAQAASLTIWARKNGTSGSTGVSSPEPALSPRSPSLMLSPPEASSASNRSLWFQHSSWGREAFDLPVTPHVKWTIDRLCILQGVLCSLVSWRRGCRDLNVKERN